MIKQNPNTFLYFILFYCLNSCASSAQFDGIKIIEENQDRKYTLLKSDFFKGSASILRDTMNEVNRFFKSNVTSQYIPTISDVKTSELVLKESYTDGVQLSNKIDGENFVRYYKKYNRQYTGYINKEGDTILVIIFMDFSNKKKVKTYFSSWWKQQNGYHGQTLCSDCSLPKIDSYEVNLRTKSIKKYTV